LRDGIKTRPNIARERAATAVIWQLVHPVFHAVGMKFPFAEVLTGKR